METYIKMSLVLVGYFYLLSMGWSYLVIRTYPKIFKFIKKGMSEKEETRITGMRVLLKLHLNDNYIFKAFNLVFIIAMLVTMYDRVTITKSMIATIIYVVESSPQSCVKYNTMFLTSVYRYLIIELGVPPIQKIKI